MWIPESALLPQLQRLSPDFGEGSLRAALVRSNNEPIPAAIALSIHVPDSPVAAREADLARLLREIAALARQVDRDREVVDFVVDASGLTTPVRAYPWAELLSAVRHQFYLAPNAARTAGVCTTARPVDGEDVAALKAAGFDHLTLETGQAQLQTVAIARRHGFRCVAVRLDTDDTGSQAALAAALAVQPERIEVRAPDGFMPESLEANGYTYVAPGQFALDGDELTRASRTGSLRLAPFGYTASRECEVIGVGPGAISQVGDYVARNASGIAAWRHAIDNGRLPAMEGALLNSDDRLREAVRQALLCQRSIPVRALEAAFRLDFRTHFATELGRLRGLPWSRHLRDSGERIEVLSPGWPWLRTMARCFDARSSRLH